MEGFETLYGIPNEFVELIRAMYEESCLNGIENGKMSDWFNVRTGVHHGCIMRGFLFIVAVDSWVMIDKHTKKQAQRLLLTQHYYWLTKITWGRTHTIP